MRNLNLGQGFNTGAPIFFQHSPLCDDCCKLGLKTDLHGLGNFTRFNKCREIWNYIAFHPSETFSFWFHGRIQPLLDICRNGFVTPVRIVPLYWGPFQWALFKLRQVLSPRPKKSGNAIARTVQNFFASVLDPLGQPLMVSQTPRRHPILV